MATPSASASVGGAIRDTEEYAAAFDLEVWKAQQQLLYQAQLRQAKENLERRLHRQMRELEQKKLTELEALRQELETMGRRLQLAEETLEKRSAQLDARENVFNAKRVKVAEQHEAYVAKAEERERRTREEAQLTQSNLQARLQEKDQLIARLQERLSAAQNEYELLRRRAARYLTEQTDTDGQRLREHECALALAHAQMAEVQRMLRDRTADAERLAEEKAHLQSQLRETAGQLSAMTRKYCRLQEESQSREWARLRKEQDALDAAKRAQAVYTVRGHVDPDAMCTLRSATTPTSLSTPACNAYGLSGVGTVGVARGKGGDEFYGMLSALKQEVTAGLALVAKNSSSSLTQPLPFKIVEKLPNGVAAANSSTVSARQLSQRKNGGSSHMTATNTVSVAAVDAAVNLEQQSVGDTDALDSTRCAESEVAKDETSSVSAAFSAIHAAQPSSISPPPPRANTRHTRGAEDGDVVVDMGDTSIESYYPHVQLQSWTNSLMMDGEDAHAVAPLPPARAGTLPPLAPELRGLYTDEDRAEDAVKGAAHASRSHVTPTPEDFVLAREAPMAGASSKSQAARRDMANFVQQLKMNREKLLETGVYSEQDHVVQEMGEKIQMYEEYLAQHR
ncbi:hypothetical protein ABL78_3038 [Leptomonas seymouri]|uniref:Uncharacterized protein n=1 Tax=Leptomonas seymouri TaxID=5684 RepID=A0A0N1HYF9_LEPSE|nr:hypothetical protein ABL78_3038 [Leptomonas seymouri]|eukprot:KPI87881.1 hypothetical protein ABL78_3038 [Leptomonas seymouri]